MDSKGMVWASFYYKRYMTKNVHLLLSKLYNFFFFAAELGRIGTNVAKSMDKDNIIGDAKQIQLTNMRASVVEL